jgi:hypothetical protein
MKLYFGGGEVPAFKNILMNNGCPPVSVSFTSFARKNTPPSYDYPGDIFFDSGAYTFNRPDSAMEFEDAYETAARYMNFIQENIGKLDLVSEFDANQLGKDVIEEMRGNFYNTLPPEKFMPIWHPDDGREELEKLCSTYQIVGVSQNDIHGDTANVPIFSQMISRYGVRLHGVGITSKKLLEAVKWDSVSSTSWLSPAKYGDTFVWTGRELMRYPKSYKHKRLSHRTMLADHGFDYQKIEDDDNEELLKLSLWSWQQYIASISGVTKVAANKPAPNAEIANTEVDNLPALVRTEERSTVMLPVMSTFIPQSDDFGSEEEPEPILIVRSESMRVCNTCFLKDSCPGFKPNANCLYNIPIEIKTRDQLDALHNGLIEMQTQRVMFMKMAEDMSGGYADPNLSSELDRLNRMIKGKVESSKSTFSMTISATESPPKPSFMEKMLGAGAAAKMRELEAPMDADNIIEAELVD